MLTEPTILIYLVCKANSYLVVLFHISESLKPSTNLEEKKAVPNRVILKFWKSLTSEIHRMLYSGYGADIWSIMIWIMIWYNNELYYRVLFKNVCEWENQSVREFYIYIVWVSSRKIIYENFQDFLEEFILYSLIL